MAEYDRYENDGGSGFMMGLLTGTVIGAGIGMLLAPKAGSELRGATRVGFKVNGKGFTRLNGRVSRERGDRRGAVEVARKTRQRLH